MKCSICKAELKSDHLYVFTKTLYTGGGSMDEQSCEAMLTVCDNCEHELMRMYRELREDVADHIY